MSNLDIIMPSLVVAFAFIIKMFVDRTTTLPQAIEGLLELPADIAFFSISLVVGFIISKQSNFSIGIFWFVLYIVFSIVIVVLWRRSINQFDKKNHKTFILLALINYLLASSMAVNIIRIMTTGV